MPTTKDEDAGKIEVDADPEMVVTAVVAAAVMIHLILTIFGLLIPKKEVKDDENETSDGALSALMKKSRSSVHFPTARE